eukprot:359232-Chlamydomonas_euryale.AAC.3
MTCGPSSPPQPQRSPSSPSAYCWLSLALRVSSMHQPMGWSTPLRWTTTLAFDPPAADSSRSRCRLARHDSAALHTCEPRDTDSLAKPRPSSTSTRRMNASSGDAMCRVGAAANAPAAAAAAAAELGVTPGSNAAPPLLPW